MADGSFWLAEGAPADTVIYRVDATTGEKAPLFDARQVRAALEEVAGFEPPYRGLPFDTFIDLGDNDHVQFQFQDREFKLSRESGGLEELPGPSLAEKTLGRSLKERITPRTWMRRLWLVEPQPAPEVLSPDGQWLAGVRDHNI